MITGRPKGMAGAPLACQQESCVQPLVVATGISGSRAIGTDATGASRWHYVGQKNFVAELQLRHRIASQGVRASQVSIGLGQLGQLKIVGG
jgi:hypothetical protein